MFVVYVAHQHFQDVLKRDHSRHAAVLVKHHCHLHASLAHLGQQRTQRQTQRHGEQLRCQIAHAHLPPLLSRHIKDGFHMNQPHERIQILRLWRAFRRALHHREAREACRHRQLR